MSTSTIAEKDIIFPLASHNLQTTLRTLKRTNLSITNRLHSIKSDSDFVLSISQTFQLPLIANERCGSWYIPPEQKAGSAYFKSTDGHHGQWSFSLRRLNLQVLEVVGGGEGGYVMIVRYVYHLAESPFFTSYVRPAKSPLPDASSSTPRAVARACPTL